MKNRKYSLGLLSLKEEVDLFNRLDNKRIPYEYNPNVENKELTVECSTMKEDDALNLDEELRESFGCQVMEEDDAINLIAEDELINETIKDILEEELGDKIPSKEDRRKLAKESIEKVLGKKILMKEDYIHDMVKVDQYRTQLASVIRAAEASGVRKDELQQMLNTLLNEGEGDGKTWTKERFNQEVQETFDSVKSSGSAGKGYTKADAKKDVESTMKDNGITLEKKSLKEEENE